MSGIRRFSFPFSRVILMGLGEKRKQWNFSLGSFSSLILLPVSKQKYFFRTFSTNNPYLYSYLDVRKFLDSRVLIDKPITL
jgi:hypothetical protein